MQEQQQEQTQNILSLLTGAQGQTSDTIQQLQGTLQSYLWIGLVFSGLMLVLVLINVLHKMRVHAAILRIDKNLQKLVAIQVPEVKKEVVETKEKSEEK